MIAKRQRAKVFSDVFGPARLRALARLARKTSAATIGTARSGPIGIPH